ncbi:MAG: sigma-54-dependent transcriptional regulator, partial [Gammaproteobacteria bacterium]
KHGYVVEAASSAEVALEKIEAAAPDFVIADVRMGGMSGIELVAHLKRRAEPPVVIVMSAYGSVELALEAMKAGAYDYVQKPFKQDEVLLALKKAEEREQLRRENRALKEEIAKGARFEGLIGQSEAMKAVFRVIERAAEHRSTVLIQGESGTGKELVARRLHEAGPWASGEFVAVNCGAIPEELFESELFGYAEGAFTSSRRGGRRGLLELAHRGTIFLDEIGEMPASQQAKLLRVIEERRVRALGSNREIALDIKVVAATNADLLSRVRDGHFREDLYYRLNVFRLHLQPLRERPEDVAPITRQLVSDYLQRYELTLDPGRIAEALAVPLAGYPFPGNVRELENFVERTVVSAARVGDGPALALALPQILPELFAREAIPVDAGGSIRRNEEQLIREALRRFDNDKSRVAEYLGISQTTLWRRLKRMDARR